MSATIRDFATRTASAAIAGAVNDYLTGAGKIADRVVGDLRQEAARFIFDPDTCKDDKGGFPYYCAQLGINPKALQTLLTQGTIPATLTKALTAFEKEKITAPKFIIVLKQEIVNGRK